MLVVHRRIHSLSDSPLGEANECVDALAAEAGLRSVHN